MKAARANANKTQDEVARRMGVSKPTYIHWESGECKKPMTFADKVKFSNIVKLPYEQIRFNEFDEEEIKELEQALSM